MSTVYNFSAGPAVLPRPVLEQAREELLDWHGSGMSVMEMSHRGKEFLSIAGQAEADLRELLAIPANYRVLFLQGGATSQFAMVPLNLLRGKQQADYINTGAWSKKAIAEAGRFCEVNVAASAEDSRFTTIPAFETWQLNPNAAYVHYTPNETIGGVEFHWVPDTGDVPLVADMSSTILSRPLDVSRYGVIYAGAQKNIGQAGLALVIVRKDLLRDLPENIPDMQSWKIQHKQGSRLNTPPSYAWYIAGLVFDWVESMGGVERMAQLNQHKSDTFYQYLDESSFYLNNIPPQFRSHMNIPFQIVDESLHGQFVAEAEAAGLSSLKGHRSVGGMRASIYNAMPIEGIQALIGFMKEFERKVG